MTSGPAARIRNRASRSRHRSSAPRRFSHPRRTRRFRIGRESSTFSQSSIPRMSPSRSRFCGITAIADVSPGCAPGSVTRPEVSRRALAEDSTNSVCPLPSTSAIPAISPRLSVKFTLSRIRRPSCSSVRSSIASESIAVKRSVARCTAVAGRVLTRGQLSDHQARQLFDAGAGRFSGGHHSPLAHHRDSVGDRERLGELVRDQDLRFGPRREGGAANPETAPARPVRERRSVRRGSARVD